MKPMTTTKPQSRAITIAILAMGGEGGGVLADWLVDLAEHNGFVAQTTSVPGVAQRTGATVYYLEMFDKASIPEGRQPVFALSPFPGHVDIVLASELMEAGRALQRGLVNPQRTTLITSSHRVYAMTERIAMGDGRMDSDKLLAGAKAAAKQFIAADFSAISENFGSLIGPALYRNEFRPAAHAKLLAGIARLTDYQSEPYATLYLDRLASLNQMAPANDLGDDIVNESARHLALWMSYEDTVRVADLKIRRSRFERVRLEVKQNEAQQLDINEFLHPRLEEIADTLPTALGRWLLQTTWARQLVGRFTKQGRIVKTTSLRGYLLLYAVASLRATRPFSLRYSIEQERISAWLS